MSRWLFAAVATCGLALPAFAQKSPEETVKSMTVADGLQVELFAAEPMVINPTSIDVDHRGRVWVCEAVNYRRKNFGRPILRPEGDRIVILTDKDGDGKADESTVFYQSPDLYGPLGVSVLAHPSKDSKDGFAYRVLVCQSPDILEFWDRDGDGKADGPPKKFLTGFRGFDHDHGVHGINVGPDGKLYFTVGDQGVDGLQSSDGKGRKWKSNNTDCQAGTVWRCDMDGTNLELIAHNFRNNYEACVNSFGEVWLSDNDDDGNQQTRICYVMPGGNYGYFPRGPGQSHWHEEQPGIVHKTLRTGFGSPTGITFYEGTLLPEKYRGQLLHTDAGPRELRAFHIKPKGAGYELEKENLVTSTDNWFRLSDVCVAPDGSVMLADWYDPGVGGHGMGDWTRGRIYRVTPKGHQGYKVPAVDVTKARDAVLTLASPALSVRHLGYQRLTVDSGSYMEVDAALNFEQQRIANPTPWLKARAQMIRGEAGLAPNFLSEKDSAEWQALAIRVEERLLRKHPHEFASRLARRIIGASPAARREALIELRKIAPAEASQIFWSLATLYDGQDHFYRAALNIACGTDPKRREAILADFDKHFPEWNDKVADLVWELRPASVLPRLGKLLDDPKLTAAQKGRIVDILAVNDDPAAGKTMLALLGRDGSPEIKVRALDNLRTFLPTKWNALAKSDELKATVGDLLKDPKTTATGLQLVAAAKFGAAIDDVTKVAADAKADTALRTEAVRTLGTLRAPKAVETLRGLLRDKALAADAVNALAAQVIDRGRGKQGPDPALEALQSVVTSSAPAEVKELALRGLAGTRPGTGWLLGLKETNKLPDDLVASAGRLLRNSPFQGERNKAMLLFPAPGKLDPKKLPSPAVLAKRAGDAKRGEAILAATFKNDAQCLRCHMVRGVGGSIGPDLSMIGKKASKENLFESVLNPSKAIADQFIQWKVNTLDGKTVTGLLVAETENSLTLRDANGKDHTFPTADLDGPKQKSLTSLMPDNLVAALTEDELIDMVEYLLTLKTASLTPDAWHVLGPFANEAGDTALDTDFGPESKPIDPSAALKGRDGPVKWATVRPTGTGYVDLMAHHAGKSANSGSYLYRVIESPADQEGVILFGNDDGAKVWVNGERVFENRDHFAASPGRHRIPVKLKKGPNAVLIKIVNGNDPHGFYFALTSDQELKAK